MKDFVKNNYSQKQKNEISKQIKDISYDEAVDSFLKLKEIGDDADSIGYSNIGNNIVDKFTFTKRLETVGNKNINFFDFYYNRNKITQKYIHNLLKYYDTDIKTAPPKVWYRIMNVYFSSITIFKPIVSMTIYSKFKPTSILDFTMGWGGRLVGACALNIPKYIGIDNNKKLIPSYNGLTKLLAEHSNTDIDLYFTDALNFDYSKLDYDFVLTSPPYYNIEKYEGQTFIKTKEEWDNEFYEPLFRKTYDGMKKGYYCLNIPIDLYDRVARKLLGTPYKKIPLQKSTRGEKIVYTEFIYVWKKD
jgi:hypothetical protein